MGKLCHNDSPFCKDNDAANRNQHLHKTYKNETKRPVGKSNEPPDWPLRSGSETLASHRHCRPGGFDTYYFAKSRSKCKNNLRLQQKVFLIKLLRSQLQMRKPFAWALGILGVGTLLVGMCAPTVTPNMVNMGRIISLSHAIAEYLEQYKALPESLDQLDYNPLLKQDKWKRPFIYQQTGNYEFTLSTLGADGSPGGIWSNADLIKKYRCENGVAHWIDQSPK